MQVIPVLDLLGGGVVHARRGDRARYQPLRSRLCASADPRDVVAALLDLHPFPSIYIADLDAIASGPPHAALVAELMRRHPRLVVWLDHGARADYRRRLRSWSRRIAWIYGTETLANAGFAWNRAQSGAEPPILSLDWRGGVLLGPPAVLAARRRWPGRVITLDLARVGSASGPDLERLRELAGPDPARAYFAGGGVRDAADLAALQRVGAAGALVATALHTGDLSAAQLRQLCATDTRKNEPRPRPGFVANG